MFVFPPSYASLLPSLFDCLLTSSLFFPLIAVEGWTIFIRGLHDEVREEDVKDKFADFGDITEVHVPLARATGYVKVCKCHS